ncbi:uncharacterized protein LOC111637481 [Centruroides sculpturatus]|uniref:uncharacterized protein LOC111637481 n=1 Tax=Centruroides sculpturatus TaxID=218467 RepID=UPI000C6ED550|nr:uncharacterized protein LOC111637481 [Centruroides sculpturatus]
MAGYCLQLGIKIKSWFQNLGRRRRDRGSIESGEYNGQFSIWNEYLVPLDTSPDNEWHVNRDLSLQVRCSRSHFTGSEAEEMETIPSLSSYMEPSRNTKIVNDAVWPECCGISSSIVTVSSCPSIIQTHDWFFPELSDNIHSGVETGGVSETKVDMKCCQTDEESKTKNEWVWFPGDDEFREKSPENAQMGINNGNSFRHMSDTVISISKAGADIKNENNIWNNVEYKRVYQDNRLNIPYNFPSYNDIWNGSNASDNRSEDVNDTLVVGKDPKQLAETEKMLTDILFDNPAFTTESKEDDFQKPSSTAPIVIERCNVTQNQDGGVDFLHPPMDKVQKTKRIDSKVSKLIDEMTRLIDEVIVDNVEDSSCVTDDKNSTRDQLLC